MSKAKADDKLVEIIRTAKPKGLGTLNKSGSGRAGKAVLFVPEGSDLAANLKIEVVGLNAAALAAMVARRC